MTRSRIKTIRTDRRPETGGLTRGVRDTGLYVREPAGSAAKRRSSLPVVTLIFTALLIALLTATITSRSDAKRADDIDMIKGVGASERTGDPTPFFASYRSLYLRLPIDPEALTALAFHQASGKKALHMTSLVPDADMELAAELKAVPPLQDEADVPDTQWVGSCLRLWRSNRSGEPDTAADVGADAGTPVWSPVTGTVLEVKPYKLYGQYDDYEIHIQPDGWPGVDVVLIHVADPLVAVGQHVEGGVTQLASVRKMSDKVELQLGGYTANGGDHVHVQLNGVDDPGVLEEVGDS